MKGDDKIREQLANDVRSAAGAQDDPECTHVVQAWYRRLVRADQLSNRFKLAYYVSVAATSLAAAAVPALIAAAGSSDVNSARTMRFLAAGLGVVVAVTTAVIGVVQVGNRWRVYRTYALDLEEAAWRYLASGKAESDYRSFVDGVDKARRAYNRDYLQEIATWQHGGAGSSVA